MSVEFLLWMLEMKTLKIVAWLNEDINNNQLNVTEKYQPSNKNKLKESRTITRDGK